MKKGTALLSLAAALAASAAALVLLRREEPEEESAPEEPDAPAPVDASRTVAFPLKNKYADYSRGESEPTYRFELDTPGGAKEVEVTQAHYDTYYIGDEVICLETDRGLLIV